MLLLLIIIVMIRNYWMRLSMISWTIKTEADNINMRLLSIIIMVVSSCTGTQRNETLTNCVTTPCMDMKTIGIPPCTGTPGQPHYYRHRGTSLTNINTSHDCHCLNLSKLLVICCISYDYQFITTDFGE